MNYYVINKLDGARVVFMNGKISLQPKGQKGDTRRLPDWARNHPDVKALESRGKVEVLSEAAYRKRLGMSAPSPVGDGVAVVKPEAPAPKPVPKPEPVPEPVREEPEEVETVEVETAPAPVESVSDLLEMDAFTALKADEQRAYLTDLGVEGDFSNQEKRSALYAEFLESNA